MSVQIVWFKRDLRVADHAPLLAAARAGPVVAVYLDEPALWEQPDASPRHRRAVAEALAGLERDLAPLGASCRVLVGEAVATLEALRARHPDAVLRSHEETGDGWSYARDRRVAAWCRDRGVPWLQEPQRGVVRGLRDRATWAARWERAMAEPIAPPPATLSVAEGAGDAAAELAAFRARPIAWSAHPAARVLPDSLETLRQLRGDRDAARRLLAGFLRARGRDYARGLSAPARAAEACSRISVPLAYGAIGLREVVRATRARLAELDGSEEDAAWRRSLRGFLDRLRWRCHFAQKLESEPGLEFAPLHAAYAAQQAEPLDEAAFAAWATGATGLPFVDACMRALIATGWMNFRMRAMLVAVATLHLRLPWREPALHLARLFADYDPGVHYPQIQMQSGTSGVNTVRLYNPVKQGLDHDPEAAFVKKFCPELAALPAPLAHEPWRMSEAEAARYGVRLGETYPRPIVDHVAAAAAARERVWSVREAPGFAERAAVILARHSGRASGLPEVARRPRAPRAPRPPDPQTAFDW